MVMEHQEKLPKIEGDIVGVNRIKIELVAFSII